VLLLLSALLQLEPNSQAVPCAGLAEAPLGMLQETVAELAPERWSC
jgi:hypothetical protein